MFMLSITGADTTDVEKLLNLNDVAALLGRSPETLRKDLGRNPGAVPPRVVIPGTRLLRWRTSDVEHWLGSHVQTSTVVGGVQ